MRKRQSSRQNPRRVLVVDDHPASRLATCVALRARGHVSKPAGAAAAALAAVEAFRPDVVLLEWNLRGGAGVGLTARLRRAAASHLLFVIAVSTQPETDGFRAQEGLDAYFTKPVSIDTVMRACEV